MNDKPTVTEVLPLVKAFYEKEGNGCGGNLHIVLDDGNIEDDHILYCLGKCKIYFDSDGMVICTLLLKMSKTQRLKIYNNRWK